MSRIDLDTTERSLVGALLVYPQDADAIVGSVHEDDFERLANRAMYVALSKIHDRGGDTGDIAAIERQLTAQGQLNLVGGVLGIGQYAEAPSLRLWARHAQDIRAAADARRMREGCSAVLEMRAEDDDPRAWLDRASSMLTPLLEGRASPDTALLREESVDLYKHVTEGKARGIPTGLHQLDTLTGGLQPGELIMLGARTSHGKSALAQTIALRARVPTILFSLEMSRLQVYPRLLAAVAEVDLSRIIHRRLEPSHRAALVRAREAIDHLQLSIVDRRATSVTDIRMQTRAFQRRHARDGRAICIVDYVQLARPSRERSSREQEVADVSRGLQALAGELDIPVLALAQISRGVETRAIKEPTLADLRESGSLEQDARAVFLLWRPELWWDDETRKRRKDELGLATLHIAKQSNGPTGAVTLRYQGQFTRFDNLTDDKQTEMPT